MSILIDTGVWYAHQDEDAPRHEAAASALRQVLTGAQGHPLASDYIVDEAYTLTLKRTRRPGGAREVRDRILGLGSHPPAFGLLWVGPEAFHAAVDVLDRYRDHDLSFTDATTVALVEDHAIDRVLSFDRGFDGIVPRLDPGDVGA